MNKKSLYGVTIIATLLLLASIGGTLAITYAQGTNDGGSGVQRGEAPFGFKLRNCFKCKSGPLGGLIQISPEYNETVMNILKSNGDVKSLLDQGYTVVSIRPVVTAYVQGDGTVIFKAGKAVVTLSNGSTVVMYVVDIVSGSVTHIATINVSAIKELRGRCAFGPRS